MTANLFRRYAEALERYEDAVRELRVRIDLEVTDLLCAERLGEKSGNAARRNLYGRLDELGELAVEIALAAADLENARALLIGTHSPGLSREGQKRAMHAAS